MISSSSSGSDVTTASAVHGARLRCTIGRGDYLLSVVSVIEIVRPSPITPVPQTPPWVLGLMQLRGRVLPVIDLAVKFGESATVIDAWSCFVVVETPGEDAPLALVLLVSRVHDVVEIERGALEPAPPLGTRIRPEFLDGLVKSGERVDIALNLDRVLSADEVVALRAASESDPDPAASVTDSAAR